MLEKVKVFFKTKNQKMMTHMAPMFAAGAALGLMPTVYATGGGGTGIDPGDVIAKVVDVVFDIFMFIGVILSLWGVGSLILAFKNEDADSKSRAIMSLVVGISLVGLKALFGDIITDLLAGV